MPHHAFSHDDRTYKLVISNTAATAVTATAAAITHGYSSHWLLAQRMFKVEMIKINSPYF